MNIYRQVETWLFVIWNSVVQNQNYESSNKL